MIQLPPGLVEIANADPEFVLRARAFTGTIRLESDGHGWDLRVENGILLSCESGEGSIETPEIVYRASAEAWENLLSETPPPFHVDAFISTLVGADLIGDDVGALGPYYPLLQRLLGLIRELRNGGAPPHGLAGALDWEVEKAVGRYVDIETEGVAYRVYYEEAGEGIPLLLQHTAGGDSRQWRHLLADPDITRDFRLVAYDLPFHGFSLPPQGVPWWQSEYLATKRKLMDWVVAISRALELDRPTFLGCSVGGHLAADLVAHHGEEFRASISMNGMYHLDPYGEFDNRKFSDPRVNDEYFASLMYGSTTPVGPEPLRREAHWIYGSGGPGIYSGDNEYFMNDHDLRQDGHLIDTAVSDLYVVVGEYDPAAAFDDAGAEAIARNVPGATFVEMAGQSHFMMIDDPVGFRAQLIPILGRIKADSYSNQREVTQ